MDENIKLKKLKISEEEKSQIINNKKENFKKNIFLYRDNHSYFNNETKNIYNQLKENNEIKKEKKIYNNNFDSFYNMNSIKDEEKLKVEKENEPLKKKLTILEYLKKIKEIQKQKSYKEGNKNFGIILNLKEETPKSKGNFQKDNFTENKKNKIFKEYKNKIKNNNKSILNIKNENNKNVNNIYFDLHKKKDNKNIVLNSIIYNSNKKNFGKNKYSNTYCKEIDKSNNIEKLNNNNCNELSSIETEFTSITNNPLNNRQKKFIKKKYVESRIVSDKNLNFLKE